MPKYIKKFELTQQRMTIKKGLTLHRIRALRDFACIKKGDLGGWVESEHNLSTDYNLAWISNNARVYGAARVIGDAWISGNAQIYGQALISEEANVDGNAMVYGYSLISDCASVGEGVRIFGEAKIIGNARVSGEAQIYEDAMVSGYALVRERAKIHGKAKVYGEVNFFGNAEACAEAVIRGKAYIGGDVKIQCTNDYVTISPIGSEESLITLTRCGMAFGVHFSLTFDELLAECRNRKMPKLYRDQYRSAIRFAERFFKC
jgi:carbonic anhydrase/acetyltransferase-like protein (isoleucine patch superfamily)